MEGEKRKKKSSALPSGNTAKYIFWCILDSATSSLYANSSCTVAPLLWQHQDPTSLPVLLPPSKTTKAQVTCLGIISKAPCGEDEKISSNKIMIHFSHG